MQLTNEFKFPVAAFHHASEAYLIPDVIKRAYGTSHTIQRYQVIEEYTGKTPAIALFATFARYKREAYRASEFAPKVLAQNGITVLMKASDVLVVQLPVHFG